MRTKPRETTLEILRRLQAQNKSRSVESSRPLVVKSASEILGLEDEQKSRIRPAGTYSEGIILLNNIKNIESRLKKGNNYFDHYYDLRKNEDKLLKFYNSFEDKENLPSEIINKVKEIQKRLKKF